MATFSPLNRENTMTRFAFAAALTATLLSLSTGIYATCLACPNCDANGCLDYWTCEDTTITCYYPSATDSGTYDGCVFTGELTEYGYYVSVSMLFRENEPAHAYPPCIPRNSTRQVVQQSVMTWSLETTPSANHTITHGTSPAMNAHLLIRMSENLIANNQSL